MDLTGVKDYSEIAYQKLKVIKDITEKENKEEEEKQKIFVENLFKKIQNNIPKKELRLIQINPNLKKYVIKDFFS